MKIHQEEINKATTERMKSVIDAYASSIGTCAYDKRNYVLSLLAEQLCEGLAGLAEDLTYENGSAVADGAEGIIDNIKEMFLGASDKAEQRRSERAA